MLTNIYIIELKLQQEGHQLIIDNARHHDTGLYVCKCSAADGHEYAANYQLNVAPAPDRSHQLPGTVSHANVGSNATLSCNHDRSGARYQWTRQHGKLAADIETTNSRLRLTNVQALDAGTYVCTDILNGNAVEKPTTLVVTGALPHFPQVPNSYIRFPKIEQAYLKFNFEVTFLPQRENGLILYNSQTPTGGDYISLSLNEGYPEFRFEFGDGPAIVRAERPIATNTWHTVSVTRVRKDGFMRVDDQTPVAFPPSKQRQGLELGENLFLGSVDNFKNVPDTATAHKIGFVGCVSQLVVQDQRVELNNDKKAAVGTTSCEPCADDPCQNDGICLESQTPTGFTCNCQSGYTGKTCQNVGDSCSPGVCAVGRCQDNEFGIDCYCPLNVTGDRCQYIEHLDENNLSFRSGSYAAYQTPKAAKLNIKFHVRPENTDDGVVLYVAESETSSGDFAAVVIKDNHFEFRSINNARISPNIIRSHLPVVANKWTEIWVGRRSSSTFMHVDKVEQQHNKIAHQTFLNLKTKLYVGGYDKRVLLHKGVGVSRGFDGCITEVSEKVAVFLVKSVQ